jgi:putative ABC transport system ATP-binding protein
VPDEKELPAADLSAPGGDGKVIVSVRSVGKVYRMGEVDVHALRDASIDIYEGEFLIVAGPSGSGKTTLLNLIGGMDRATSGVIAFGDEVLSDASDRRLTMFRRREVGFVFQFFNLIPTLTALENVQVALEIVEDPMDPLGALRLVGLAERAGHFPSQLSGGEQQRVAVARALVMRPSILLADEPTGDLDEATADALHALLREMHQGYHLTSVIATHNPRLAAACDRILRLECGRLTPAS